jgi:hypothetical protein
LGGTVALPSLYGRTAGPEFDNSSRKFCFFRQKGWVPHFSRFLREVGLLAYSRRESRL